ncbi:50S ribosomal protein P1 [Halorubrum sp. GN11_10-6_MGM]|uniref:50S ribosomal protein P1 n=1 Tax=Halorubrum sp. GN11_10-6_MGM TaxID=2518112 RepID=UPI0010F9CE01|nr:50S ribosomal protein P1 [Halorubrum sp. GN11_10-6_MGM]TKX75964.1 50S ribosomal protein P1 [Halorubrum sp. GN11_10-6_MGM]
MEYVYAALILNETGEEINEDNVTGVLEAAGVDVEESRVKALVAALEDVDIEEAIETAAAAPAAGASAGGAADADASADEADDDDDEAGEADAADEADDDEEDGDGGEGLGELFG